MEGRWGPALAPPPSYIPFSLLPSPYNVNFSAPPHLIPRHDGLKRMSTK